MERIFQKRALVSAVSLMAMAGASGVASAAVQETDQQDVTEIEFEEIIVTAGRREQSLQDVPASVAAIKPEQFTTKGLKQIGEIFNYATGVYFTAAGAKGAGHISARGVPQSSSMPVFGVYLDDTPVSSNSTFSAGSSVLLDAMLMDIERAEIIKGPQGTLYGATSVGGMMRYISRDPALEEFRASFGVDFSTVASGGLEQIYNGRISVPVIEDKLGITLSGFYQDNDGYVDYIDGASGAVLEEDINRSDSNGYAVDVLFKPSDELTLRLKYMRQENNFDQTSSVTLAGLESDAALTGEYTSVVPPGESVIDYEIISGTISYDFGWGTLSSTSSWVEYGILNIVDQTAAYAALVDLYDGRDAGTTNQVLITTDAGSEKFVQEVRLTSERMGAFEWIVGAYFADEDTFNDQTALATPYFNLLTIAFPSFYKEKAVFGDVTYYINEKFDVTAGLRLSDNETTLSYTTSGAFLGVADLVTDTVEDTVDTWLFSARYRPADNISLYTRVASGYRPASANLPIIDPLTGENIAPSSIGSDNAWSYEIGAKGFLGENRLTYDISLWMIDWANFQAFTSFNGVNTGGNAAGGLSAYGFEGSFVYRPVDGLSLTANINHSISELNEDEPGIGGTADEQYAGLPKWNGSFQADYAFGVSDSWTALVGAGMRYNSSFVSAFSQSTSQAPIEVDSRLLVDMNVSFTRDNLTLGFYATNLFNERSLVRRTDSLLSTGAVDSNGIFETPRTLGFNMKVDF